MSAPKAGSQAANLLHKAVVGGLMLGTAIVLIDFTGIAGKIVYRRKIQGISAMDDIQAAEAAKEAESQAAATSAEASSATAAEASSATPAPAPAQAQAPALATIGTALPHTCTPPTYTYAWQAYTVIDCHRKPARRQCLMMMMMVCVHHCLGSTVRRNERLK